MTAPSWFGSCVHPFIMVSLQKEAGSKDDTSHCNNSACFANMPGIKVDPETGAICKQSLMEACLLDRVKLVAQILCNDGGPFKETFTITKARVPVIKTVHSPTGLRCDLSINNGLVSCSFWIFLYLGFFFSFLCLFLEAIVFVNP